MGSMKPDTGSSVPGPLPSRPLLSRAAIPCPYPRAIDPSLVQEPAPSAISEVEKPDVLGICLNELASQIDVFAHQDRADLVGQCGLFHLDLQQRAAPGVHGGVP